MLQGEGSTTKNHGKNLVSRFYGHQDKIIFTFCFIESRKNPKGKHFNIILNKAFKMEINCLHENKKPIRIVNLYGFPPSKESKFNI